MKRELLRSSRTTAPKRPAAKNEAAKPAGTRTPAKNRPCPGPDCYVVGIGASAGGLKALEQLIAALPPKPNMAFVVVSHLEPTHVSLLPELLRRHTKLSVRQAEDGMALMPNAVFTIPPNCRLTVAGGLLHTAAFDAGGPRLTIDEFLRSLAFDCRERAICVILSGTGTDGTLGLRAVKAEMGLTMAQEPRTAAYDGMVTSAIATGLVDYILPPAEMPAKLMEYARRAARRPSRPARAARTNLADPTGKALDLLRRRTGHDFSLYKRTTVARRIERRMDVNRIEDLPGYLRYLEETPGEADALLKDLLIGVTSFFREPEAFEQLRRRVLPGLIKTRADGETLRAWVPGCSTGEEAYSVAIILREVLDEAKRNLAVQVFGTDIDADAVAAARTGTYPSSIVTDVKPDRLRQFFVQEHDTCTVRRDVRETLVFAPQSIIKDPPFTRLDLLSCRNLMIYLDAQLQRTLIPLFHYCLRPGGILFLGTSESIGEFGDLFSPIDRKWKIYRRRDASGLGRAAVVFPSGRAAPDREAPAKARPLDETQIARLAGELLLEYYAPPCVIIDPSGNVIFVHGRTGRFLEPAPGRGTLNVIEMAREGLRLELPSAIRAATSHKRTVVRDDVRIRHDKGYLQIRLTVRPLREPEAIRGFLMVSFEELPHAAKTGRMQARTSPTRATVDRVAALELELKHTRHNLSASIEELGTSNEELKSANEELQSANEELQSTNEEIATSSEELQSTNEELLTVNAELQGKIDELALAQDDMTNLLDSVELPALFLDSKLHIKRFTSHLAGIISLIPGDIGRPIDDIATKLDYSRMSADAAGVMRTLVPCEQDVRASDGKWYRVRIRPYRTGRDVIDGAVITFTGIDAQKQMEAARRYAESIIDTVREPLLVLDDSFKVVSANRAFYRRFQTRAEDTVGRPLFELDGREWDIPELRRLLEQVIPTERSFEGFELELDFAGLGRRRLLLNARAVADDGPGTRLILLAIEDAPADEENRRPQITNKPR
jgi:two-component system, chemotaxis family, CheB/CheR fusion protein